jgi:hypothetical protein
MPDMMNGKPIVWVTKPLEDGTPTGPSPCYEDMLHYAIANGYKQCDPPNGKVDDTVAPDPTPEDVVGEDNGAAIAAPDTERFVTTYKKRR